MTLKSKNCNHIQIIKNVFTNDDRVIFAYLYGSYMESSDHYNDLDIAVYLSKGYDPFRITTDLKIKLHEWTALPPDFFDIRILNDLLDKGDILALLYLKNVFHHNMLLVDKDFDIRTDYLEKYSMKYRECESLIDEVLR